MSTIDLHAPAATTASHAPATPASGTAPAPHRKRVRTNCVVDWRSQLKGSMFSIGLVAAMLVLVNVMFYHLGEVSTAVATEQAKAMLAETDMQRRGAMFILSVFFLLGFTLLRIFEAHKVHGAAHNICRRLGELEAGRYSIFVRVRHSDELQGVAAATNNLLAALSERTRNNIETLEQLVQRAEDFGPVARDLRSNLQELLDEQKQLLR